MIDELVSKVNNETTYDKEAYIKKKKEQIDWAYRTVEECINDIKSKSDFFVDYLNVQSKFDMYSPRNALLLAKQNPDVIQLKEWKEWDKLGVIFRNVYPKKLIIIEPTTPYINKDGKKVTPYKARELIDVSETNIKPLIKTYDRKLVLQALLFGCQSVNIPIKAVDELKDNKICEWNSDDGVIYIKRNDNYDELIKSISFEISKINLYQLTNEIDINKAECISYMLCKKYGIDTTEFKPTNILNKYSNMESKEIIEDLSTMKDVLLNINLTMGKYLESKIKENRVKEQER